MPRDLRSASAWLSLVGAGAILVTAALHGQSRWVNLAPFPEPKEEVLGASAAGKVYVFAGINPIWKPVGMVYEYDPAGNKWTKKKPMALASHHVAFATYADKIYAFGGFVSPPSDPPGWVPIDNAWEYDPVADSWKALAPMPVKRGAAAAAAVGDKIYVVGGVTTQPWAKDNYLSFSTPQRGLGTVQEYDPKTNSWRERAPMPTPRNHVGIGAVNGKIYVIGGRVGAAFIGLASDVSLVEAYDPATDTWGTPGARMPTTRSALGYGVYGGKIYIAGGEFQDPVQQTAFRSFEAYDPAANSWSVLPPMQLARHGAAAAVVGNRFYIVSGDVQSAGTGLEVSTPNVAAYELPQ